MYEYFSPNRIQILTNKNRCHDNTKFASCGGDRSVFLWDVSTGVTTRRLAGHLSKIYCVQFNEDSSVLASGMFFTGDHLQRR